MQIEYARANQTPIPTTIDLKLFLNEVLKMIALVMENLCEGGINLVCDEMLGVGYLILTNSLETVLVAAVEGTVLQLLMVRSLQHHYPLYRQCHRGHLGHRVE
jgi:hypothetical protein